MKWNAGLAWLGLLLFTLAGMGIILVVGTMFMLYAGVM